ncbi:5-oxoprolinase subunit PxpB [Pandoraea sputorum]|uniref:Sporulation inhibitor kipI n=1 Tax=Pandoraea sputorum TaxID=93222 RepID=A0A239S8B8_9BURK|nr:5-oxoprolinase subunit PxpB [Pandoraea sputorum]AJC15692.1 allophanate hydrolase [Pandoraea sputorum]SNU81158.1 Sporulation inhibitor kipI [Pandoraea sputorum]VVD69936.1 allophanate hydrolase [Pandoraea sputorum]
MTTLKILPLGDSALVCEAGTSPTSANLATQRRVWHVATLARDWHDVREVVPGMNNLTLLFDPLATDIDVLSERLRDAWQTPPGAGEVGRDIEIPVQYGGKHGPDLADVAKHARLQPKTVVQRHTAPEYIVYFIGFQPGFAYLGGLDDSIAAPRRAEPRLSVPAGSVGIGGNQTGIYPLNSPGGWQIIGHATSALFDPAATPPALLAPGDRVRFTIASLDL